MKRNLSCLVVLLLSLPLWAKPSSLEFQKRAQELQRTLGNSFTVLQHPPFLVAGDETPQKVKKRLTYTILWAYRHLKKAYKFQDPPYILEVYLFRDRKSYFYHAQKLFGEKPSTPFGYYLSEKKALVMNIATGGGTLVHEMVHPFLEHNFPKCPPWFNEGLASLYEQCSEKKGRIWGLTNWRLRGLQKAIRQRRLPSLQEMFHASRRQFYGAKSGIYYAMARYTLYYLQVKGKLLSFYHTFRQRVDRDPTGEKTFLQLVQKDSLAKFQKVWEPFVLKLKYP